MVSLSAAVVAELPDSARLSMLGVLRVAGPDPVVPLIELNATFAGQCDSAEPSAFLMVSLNASHMAGIPLNGDVLLLSRGGSDPTFVLSAGGFHPALSLPRGVPALHRLSMNLSPVPWIQLRCEAYFAFTSNTVHFGAQLFLVAEIAGCGLRGPAGHRVLPDPGRPGPLARGGPRQHRPVSLRGVVRLRRDLGKPPAPLPAAPPDLEGELRTAFGHAECLDGTAVRGQPFPGPAVTDGQPAAVLRRPRAPARPARRPAARPA